MSSVHPPSLSLRWAVALALGLGLAACSDKPAPAATTAAPAAATASATAAAEAAASQAAQQQAAALASLTADELRARGRQALREQRIYTPAGNNAMEYYLALRKKSDKPDASAESALMDLQPYAVIAAEQALTREDFLEAERLRSLIAAADPQAPSLTRIAEAIAKGKAAVIERQTLETTRTADQALAAEAARLKAIQDAKTAQLAAAQAAAATPAREAPASAPVREAPPVARDPEPVASAPVQAPPRPAAREPAAPSNQLVSISTPQPAYPADAQRSGVAGEVVVSFTVNPDGSVSNVAVVRAKPRGVFERSVQTAVRKWRFQPMSDSQNVTRTFAFAQ